MPLKLTVGAIENHKFDASLEYISPKGVEENGAILFEIKAAARIPDSVLVRAGYSANAEIVLAKVEDVVTIPESTITFSNDSSYVQIYKGLTGDTQEFEMRHIKIGLSDGINVELVSGLNENDEIRGGEVNMDLANKPKGAQGNRMGSPGGRR